MACKVVAQPTACIIMLLTFFTWFFVGRAGGGLRFFFFNPMQVDATLTPAVDSLTETAALLKLRILRLETACDYNEFEKVSSKGETLDDFQAAVCVAVGNCKVGQQFETAAPTKTTDRVCQAAKRCKKDEEYMSVDVTATKDRECTALTKCTEKEEYESGAPTATTNRECSAVTECKAAEVEKKKPTATSNRVCDIITPLCKVHLSEGSLRALQIMNNPPHACTYTPNTLQPHSIAHWIHAWKRCSSTLGQAQRAFILTPLPPPFLNTMV